MAEQWIKAFLVNEEELQRMVGCLDPALVERAESEQHRLLADLSMGDEQQRADRTAELEAALAEVVASTLVEAHDPEYLRVLEGLLGVCGEQVGELLLPGRGWNFLSGWSEVGLTALAATWGTTNVAFPWAAMPPDRPGQGPVVMRFGPDGLETLVAQLDAVAQDGSRLHLIRVRWDDDDADAAEDEEEQQDEDEDVSDEEDDDAVEEIASLVAHLRDWSVTAKTRHRTLYLWHDGAMG
jgi:hypothetical protein